MMRRLLMVAGLVAFSSGASATTDGWSQLRAGMTRGETVAVLGSELMASKARGFELAIYDGRAEVVFLRGHVVAWTAPAASTNAPASPEAWQFNQSAQTRAMDATRSLDTTGAKLKRNAVLPAYRL